MATPEDLERQLSQLASSVSSLTTAVGLVNEDVKKHSETLRRIELASAIEEGKRLASEDIRATVRAHGEAILEIANLKKMVNNHAEGILELQRLRDKGSGILWVALPLCSMGGALLMAGLQRLLGW